MAVVPWISEATAQHHSGFAATEDLSRDFPYCHEMLMRLGQLCFRGLQVLEMVLASVSFDDWLNILPFSLASHVVDSTSGGACLLQVAGQQGEWLASLFNKHHIGSTDVIANGKCPA